MSGRSMAAPSRLNAVMARGRAQPVQERIAEDACHLVLDPIAIARVGEAGGEAPDEFDGLPVRSPGRFLKIQASLFLSSVGSENDFEGLRRQPGRQFAPLNPNTRTICSRGRRRVHYPHVDGRCS